MSADLSVGHTNRLLREHTSLSQMFDTPLTATSSQGSDWPQVTVQNASVMHSAEPPNANGASANASVLTIRPPAPVEPAKDEAQVEKPNIFAGTGLDAKSASLGPEGKMADVSRSQVPMGSGMEASKDGRPTNEKNTELSERIKEKENKLRTRYPPQPNQKGDDEIGPLPDRVLGTHRFTVVTKAPENPSKKASGSESLEGYWWPCRLD